MSFRKMRKFCEQLKYLFTKKGILMMEKFAWINVLQLSAVEQY